MPAILTEQLTKHFPPDIKAVDGIDLSIAEGKIFAFLGQNGSGKTTTVRMLTTLLRPTSGRAQVDGLDVLARAAEVRRRIGVALQEAALDDMQTGRELLVLQARLYGVPTSEINERVGGLLKIVELDDAADRLDKTYSCGMKRRLDLGAALVHNPKIIFLDEPTTGLDPIGRDAIWRYVEALNRDGGVTFFLTTQYLEEADRLAHEVAIVDRGRIVAAGSPDDLKASIGTDVVTVRVPGDDDNAARAAEVLGRVDGASDVRALEDSVVVYIKDGSTAIPAIVLRLSEASIPMREVTLSRPTLDDVFLRMTGHHIEADRSVTRPEPQRSE
ncbi:MAG: ATP-binding cassette domain-containing protein [Chloroflexi bacterium]|nr:MAG: ATP-binding cassette domain-containing protein [Chloroflexota bacterium]